MDKDVRFLRDGAFARIDATNAHHANTKARCSKCMRVRPSYDHLPMRRFEFVPLGAIAVFLLYCPRRVHCPQHGVVVEPMPWSDGKSPLTIALMCLLAACAKRLSWWETANIFGSTWDKVRVSVQRVVHWGLEHRKLDGIQAIGIDEIANRKGHKYMSVVYDISPGSKRLLWIGQGRTKASIKQSFWCLGFERCSRILYVCSDMGRPYLDVIRTLAPNALNILDRFHIVNKLEDAVDQTRRGEAAELRRKADRITLHKARWPLLEKVKNLCCNQMVCLQELLKLNLRTVWAYLMVEDFDQPFWDDKSPAWADKFLGAWCTRALRSRIEPIKKVAKTLRSHAPLILNDFPAKKQLNSGMVESLNNKLKRVTRKSYGFRSAEPLKIALDHAFGDLPTPPLAHRFA